MEYQVIFLINGKREKIIIEHIKEEYGVSECEFWSCWIDKQKHFVGDGETAELAVMDMIKNIEQCARIMKEYEVSLAEAFNQFAMTVSARAIHSMTVHAIQSQQAQSRLARILP